MTVQQPRILPSAAGRVRLCADVRYDSAGSEPETYWFDVPEAYQNDIATTGDPWLACLAPLAVTLNEPLRIEAPVDRVLWGNVEELMRVWSLWHPGLDPVPIEATVRENGGDRDPSTGRRTAAFFSGGVDAFFTVLRHDDPAHLRVRRPVDDLLTVWGFDIRLDKPDEFACMRDALRGAAGELGKGFIDIGTNLRTTRWREATWATLAHGPGLASVALTLGPRFRAAMIGSSAGYARMHPWGSHPVTDPLLSTSETEIVHDGATHERVEKTAYISSSAVAGRTLHVCYQHEASYNCGRCAKCVRTMLALKALGRLEAFQTLDQEFDPTRARPLYIEDHIGEANMAQIGAFAQSRGQDDVVQYVRRSARHSRRSRLPYSVLNRLTRTRFSTWVVPLRSRLARESINLSDC